MRKTLFLFVAFLVATSMYAYDFTFKSGDYLYGATSDTTVEVAQDASYSSLTAIDIPATVERNGKTYTVTSIAEDAFRFCYNLATITIPKTLVKIGNGAFYGTAWYDNQPDGLVYIDHILYKYKGTMPNGMAVAIKKGTASIAQSAFANCEGLAGIIFPSTLQYIGGSAFYNCVSLTELTFPASLIEIDRGAFNGCTGLTSITLPETVTRVGTDAFAYCTGLTEVITAAKTIEGDVFEGCTKLTSVVWDAAQYKGSPIGYGLSSTPFYSVRSQIKSFTFGTNVDTIPYGLCYDMGEQTSFTLPNSVVAIKEDAFRSCTALKSVTFGDNLKDIGAYAFSNCISLSEVSFPTSLNTIGYEAFRGCTALKTITIPQNVTFIRNYCFAETGITSVQWNAKSMGWISADAFGDNPTQITSFVLGENVEVIPDYLCYYMTNITSITIPASVTTIGLRAFIYCKKVTFKSATPPSIYSSECFSRNATLYVPCGSFDTYRDANYGYYITDLKYRAIVTAQDYNMGGVNKETDCEKNTVVATAIANSKYKFVQWSDGNTDNPRTIILTQDTSLRAEFAELPSYSITLNGRYLGGNIYNEKGTWESNIPDASTTFKCYEGWYIAITEIDYCGTWIGWSDGVKEEFRTIVVSQDTVLTALSDAKEYAISITAGEHGRLLIDNNTYGSIENKISECDTYSVDVCATPDEGYYFLQWSDGSKDICRNIYLEMEDITLVAQFEPKKPVSVKAEVASGCENMGSVALTETETLYAGDNASITATPNEGYHFVEWEDGSVDNPRTVYLTSDTTLVATFAKGNIGGKCGEKLYWVLDTLTMDDGTGYNQYYSNTLTITGEGDMDVQNYHVWKYYKDFYTNIRTIHLPEGMTSISSRAFNGCNVEKIIIPSTVTEIGQYAFGACYNLRRFEFETDSYIYEYNCGNNILSGTYSLEYFKGPAYILGTMYPYGSALDTVIVTSGVLNQYIPYNARYVDLACAWNDGLYYRYLTVATPTIRTLLLPKNLTYVLSQQFWNYSYLQSIVIPEGVTFIGDKAFEDCRSLKSVTFEGKSVETIGDWAFYNCHELNSITIPEGVKSIGLSAFYGCTYLQDLKLPSTVESIADNGFAQCGKLQQISVSAMVPPVIDAKTFEGVDKTIPLLVPVGMRQAYADAPYWQEFINIREELPSDVSNAVAEDGGATVRKVLRDGQVLIIRNGKTYTLTGEEVK